MDNCVFALWYLVGDVKICSRDVISLEYRVKDRKEQRKRQMLVPHGIWLML